MIPTVDVPKLLTQCPFCGTINVDSVEDTVILLGGRIMDRERYTIYMKPEAMHKTKVAAAMLGLSVSGLLEELVEHLTETIPGMPSETQLKQVNKNKEDLLHKTVADTLD